MVLAKTRFLVEITIRPLLLTPLLILTVLLKGAHELKKEGNKRFQEKDYVGALQQYGIALKLTPKLHPDRAVFHSNRAACLM